MPAPAGVYGGEVGVARGAIGGLGQRAERVQRGLARRLEGERARGLAALLRLRVRVRLRVSPSPNPNRNLLEARGRAEALAEVLGAEPRLAQLLVCRVGLATLGGAKGEGSARVAVGGLGLELGCGLEVGVAAGVRLGLGLG